jgi:hypothetical protein
MLSTVYSIVGSSSHFWLAEHFFQTSAEPTLHYPVGGKKTAYVVCGGGWEGAQLVKEVRLTKGFGPSRPVQLNGVKCRKERECAHA